MMSSWLSSSSAMQDLPGSSFGNKGHGIDIPPPKWVEQVAGYSLKSCMWRDEGEQGKAVVLKYWTTDIDQYVREFAKVYVMAEHNGFVSTGHPFPQMSGIWKEVHARISAKGSCNIDEDGKIYDKFTGSLPRDDEISAMVYFMLRLYRDWRNFPNAPDYKVVQDLLDAKKAVEDMKEEDKNGWIQKNIDDKRSQIQELQKGIAGLEKDMNEMYEKAAEGMNLLEKYDVPISLEPEEVKVKAMPWELPQTINPSGHLMSIPSIPSISLNFVGQASIVKKPDGSYCVTTSWVINPKSGDVVVDPVSGMSAVFSASGKWEVVSIR